MCMSSGCTSGTNILRSTLSSESDYLIEKQKKYLFPAKTPKSGQTRRSASMISTFRRGSRGAPGEEHISHLHSVEKEKEATGIRSPFSLYLFFVLLLSLLFLDLDDRLVSLGNCQLFEK